MRKVTLSILVWAVFGSVSFAQENAYVGVGYGSFDYDEGIVDPVLGPLSESVGSVKLFGGFEMNDHLALEISYGETSDIIFRGTENVPPFGDVTTTLKSDLVITNLTALGQLPLDWGVLFGGLGLFSSEQDFRQILTAACCQPLYGGGKFNEDGMSAKLGIEWRFGRFGTRIGLRLEYDWLDLDYADASQVGFAISYGF